MRYEQEFEEAGARHEPLAALRALVTHLIAKGLNQRTMVDLFDSFRATLRAPGRDVDEDVVLEVMDQIVGWCSPHVKRVRIIVERR